MSIVPYRRDDPGRNVLTDSETRTVSEPLLSDDEIRRLYDALRAGPGSAGFEADVHALASWAQRVRIEGQILELVLAGALLVQREPDGEWAVDVTPAALAHSCAKEGGRN